MAPGPTSRIRNRHAKTAAQVTWRLEPTNTGPVLDALDEATRMPKTEPEIIELDEKTRDELQRLLAVCDLDIKSSARFTGIRNKAMLLVFLDSGIRRAEQNNLRLGDIDLNNKSLRVIGKGNKIGIAPFSTKTAKKINLTA